MIKEDSSALSDYMENIRVSIQGKKYYYPGVRQENLDTYVELFKREDKKWVLIDSTEIVYSTNIPEYQKQFDIIYQFEEIFRFMVVVYRFKTSEFLDNLSTMSQAARSNPSKNDLNSGNNSKKNSSKKKRKGEKSEEKDILGRAEFDLGLLVGAAPQNLLLELEYGEETVGEVELSYVKTGGLKKELEIKLKAKAVKNIEWFSKTDPFIRIYRVADGFDGIEDPEKISEKGWEEVYVSEHVDNCLDPDFEPFSITAMKLCKGNINSFLKVEIFNYCQNQKIAKKDKFISRGFFKLSDAIEFHHKNFEEEDCFEIETFDRKKKFSGRILIEKLKVTKFYSMIDFLKSNLNISMAFGYDFTGSNGNPDDARSHHFTMSGMNPYQKITHLVGNLLKPYDRANRIYSFGFGAKVEGYSKDVSHCFPINGNMDKPYVKSLKKLKKKYNEILPHLELLGPTYFSGVLKKCLDIIKKDQRDLLEHIMKEMTPKKNNYEDSLNNFDDFANDRTTSNDKKLSSGMTITSFDNDTFPDDLLPREKKLESSIIQNLNEKKLNFDKRYTAKVEEIKKFTTPQAPRVSAYAKIERRVSYIPPTVTIHQLPKMPQVQIERSKKKKKSTRNLPPLNYQVIFLLTDGDLCDPEAVLRELIRANSLPVSLIVVGIGEEVMKKNEEYFRKRFLQNKTDGGIVRNFMKFVYWRDYAKMKKDGSRQFLRDCLTELPIEIVRFYKLKNIVPMINNKIDSEI